MATCFVNANRAPFDAEYAALRKTDVSITSLINLFDY